MFVELGHKVPSNSCHGKEIGNIHQPISTILRIVFQTLKLIIILHQLFHYASLQHAPSLIPF